MNENKKVYGMVHVRALPGTPLNNLSPNVIAEIAINEAEKYVKEGIDGIIIENMHDIPYLNSKCGPEIVSTMTLVAKSIRDLTERPIGIQILAGCNKEALAVAFATGLDFVRVEGYVYSHIADEGLMNSCAGELLRYRKAIGADKVSIYTDIKKKHSSHMITNDLLIEEHANAAEFFLSDGLIITGSSTGVPASIEELKRVRETTELPILIGSGLTADNLADYYHLANGFIVGSYFKKEGLWSNSIDINRVKSFLHEFRRLKS